MQGVRGYVGDVFGATKNGDTTVKNQLLAPSAQAKLATLVGPDKAQGLISSLQQEDALAQRAKNITGGSPTHANQQASVLSGPAAIPGAVSNYIRNFALDRPGSWLGMAPGAALGQHEAQTLAQARAQLAPILTTPNGDNAALVQALLNGVGRRGANHAAGTNASDLAAVLLSGAGQEGNRQINPQFAPYSPTLAVQN